MLGHVNHATMITFMEHARWAMLEPQMTVYDWFRSGVWPVVRHVDVGYSAQAVPGDDLVVRSGLVDVGTSSFRVRQRAPPTRSKPSKTAATSSAACAPSCVLSRSRTSARTPLAGATAPK
jgi:acyl-CoA thioesterase FadM